MVTDFPALIDIRQIFKEVNLQRCGRRWRGRCPFPDHEDRHPSFYVSDEGLWYCFGCRRGGNIRTYLRLMGRLGELSQRSDDGHLAELLQVLPPPSERCWELLERRCIPRHIFDDLCVREGVECELGNRFVKNWKSFIGRVIFPHYRNNGSDVANLIGWSALHTPRYVYVQGLPFDIPFGLSKISDMAEQKKQVAVVEGIFDALTAWVLGIPAVAALGGSRRLYDFLTLIPSEWKIILIPDSPLVERQSGGFYYALKWSADAIIAGRYDAELLILAPPFKDLNDAHQAGCVEEVIQRSARKCVVDYLCETILGDNNAADAHSTASVLKFLPPPILEEALRRYPQIRRLLSWGDAAVRRVETAFRIISIAMRSREGRRIVFSHLMPLELPRTLRESEQTDEYLPPYLSAGEVERACLLFARYVRRKMARRLLSNLQFIWGIEDE